eukprot:TRINITY_DN18592_c0_g1_i1.p1 TRINITY_DN18592_c0_g1~~TRINITY_DN18592_c0_g1_i1.p1  ORF type:complete len:240 (+),score=36.38 TRINITY_DN18592_c0_g1_i1:31-750(+)
MSRSSTSRKSQLIGDEVAVHDIDTGRRCKVVLKRGVGGITIAKLKTNLEGHFGVPARDQVLTMGGEELLNSRTGKEAGLYPGCSVDLRRIGSVTLRDNNAENFNRFSGRTAPPSDIDDRPVSVHSAATESQHDIDDYRYCRCRNCHAKPRDSEQLPDHKVIYNRNNTLFQQSDYTQRDEERAKLEHLQSAYTDLVKKQQWVLEGDSFNGGQAGLQSQAAAYKAGTHPYGLGVVHMRPTY